MERTTRNTLLTVLFLLAGTTFLTRAQTAGYDTRFYTGYITNSMGQWKPLLETAVQPPATGLHGESLLRAYYGYTAWLLSKNMEKQAESYIEKSEQLIDQLLDKNPKNASAYAFRGAFFGFQIGIAPYKALVLGPKSTEAIRYALQLDPQNIQAWVEKGNAAYYTPSWFGGSKETAVKAYSTAIQLMEFHNQTQHNWLYMNALTMLAQAQQRTNRIQEANATYRKILSLEPNYVWVRDELYPQFKMKYLSTN